MAAKNKRGSTKYNDAELALIKALFKCHYNAREITEIIPGSTFGTINRILSGLRCMNYKQHNRTQLMTPEERDNLNNLMEIYKIKGKISKFHGRRRTDIRTEAAA
ncbi:MAG: hypothetical protein R3250_14290 [Melioribacteraceae bacterium]|nr:hypothetical protein [Melioribacteraceae bacterium]